MLSEGNNDEIVKSLNEEIETLKYDKLVEVASLKSQHVDEIEELESSYKS